MSDEDSDRDDEGTVKIKDEVMSSSFPPEDIKMVLVVREDLKMGKGKIGA